MRDRESPIDGSRRASPAAGQPSPTALTLYFAPGSSSMAPHIALHEVGEPFDARPVSFARHEQRDEAFLRINPQGKVPVLLVGTQALTEVAAILYFLAQRHPQARLWPHDDPIAQARVISWMSFLASTVHPARRQGIDHARRVWGLAERRLGEAPWAVGEFGIADIHLFRLFWRMRSSLHPSPQEFPALEAHHARMLERDAVRRTLAIESAIGYEVPA